MHTYFKYILETNESQNIFDSRGYVCATLV